MRRTRLKPLLWTPAAGHRQDAIARLHGPSIHHGIGFHHGHAEAGQVVFAGGIEARHLGGFAAEQGAAALAAAIGDALHHLGHGLRAELAGGDVVQEKQGLGAAGDHVVDAHRHQVDAHGVVAAVGLGQLQLGAHPITAGHEQGLAQALRQSAEATEAAEAAHHLRPSGGVHAAADPFHEGPSGHHIHPSCAVVHRSLPRPRRRISTRSSDAGGCSGEA
jgi:hypothetical protein